MLSVILLGVVCVANIMLAVAVMTSNPKARVNRFFGALTLVLPLWSIVAYLEDATRDLVYVDLLAKADFALAGLMIALFYWFCRSFVPRRSKGSTHRLFFALLGMEVLALGGFVTVASIQTGDTVLQPGPAYPVFLIYMGLTVIGGVIQLWRAYRLSKGKTRAQLRFVNTGIFLTVTMLLLADVLAPRIPGLASPDVTRLGIYSILFFTGFTTYAVIRHRFLDIRVLVARTVAYVLLLITLAGIYAAGLLGTTQLFFKGAEANIVQNIVTTILAIVLAFTFQPLRRFFERLTDRIFYRDRYDSQEVINDFSKVLVSELDLNRILKRSLSEVCARLNIQFGQILIFNNERVYRIEHYGPLPKRLMIAPELKRLNKPMLIADELHDSGRKDLLEAHGIRVAIQLRTREEFVGHLLLGDKLSGDIYSTQDIKLLEIITKELAVAILNAKAYAEIEEFNRTLQARVDHATNRLRVANRHLKELDRAKDEFISMASHQLRTPLTTIKGYLSMMLEGDSGSLTATQKEFVGYAFSSSERMVNLISDLLNVSRLSAGRFLIQTKPTDMVVMIADEVRQLATHAKAKNIGLVFDPPPGVLPPAEIDENKTRQVIMNFIDNAIYYTQTGQVTVTLKQSGNSVRLEVTDTGIGVPEAAKKKLFSKFFRADNAQIVRPDGTGLGLYLAKRVVEDQGGTIIFDSTEGKGSTFGFELPFKPQTVKREEKNVNPK